MEYRQTMHKKQALIQTIQVVTVSILTSGIVLTVVGFLLGYITTHGILSQLGLYLGRGAVLSLITVLFVLPGLLYLTDKIIGHTTLHANILKKENSQEVTK